MPKLPPYYARVTFMVTVTQALASSQSARVTYTYSIGSGAERSFLEKRMAVPPWSTEIDELATDAVAMIWAHVGDIFPKTLEWGDACAPDDQSTVDDCPACGFDLGTNPEVCQDCAEYLEPEES